MNSRHDMADQIGSRDRGQILIVVAAGLLVLMAIAAIAIDLGFSWMLRRQEQNAADPAAIAAARHLTDALGAPSWSQAGAEADACFYAQQNGFFEADPGCTAAIAAGDLLVRTPPVSGQYAGQPGHVQVTIKETHPAFFGRIFGATDLTVTTSATAANTAGNANSASLVALQDVCAGGAAGQIVGGGTVRIYPAASVPPGSGGGVHVNSPCGTSTDNVCSNGSGSSGLSIAGRLEATSAAVVGTCTVPGSDPGDGLYCTTAICPDEGAITLGDPLLYLQEPAFGAGGGFPNATCPDGSASTPTSTSGCVLKNGLSSCPDVAGVGVCVLDPGVYYGGWDIKSNVKVFLNPGMYILAGGGIKLSGSSSIEAVDDGSGQPSRVTIFSSDGPGCPSIGAQCQGDITFTANQAFKVRATPGSDPALFNPTCRDIMPGYNLCPWAGLLLWQDGTASNPTKPVNIGGQASTVLSGTIYAPKANVSINGGTSTTGCSGTATASCLAVQIISWTWKIDGNAQVDMPYNPDELVKPERRGLVY